ncbi:MAG TPA: phage holin family protein [Dongiaceae bacterium]|nr:phage holin family protein [Dongiaceae bacterium]
MSDAYPGGDGAAETRGPAERLLRLGENLLAIFIEAGRTRIELLTVEFAVERLRVIRMLAMAVVFSIAVLLGLAFASFLVIAFFWDTYRLAAIGGVTIFYAAIAVVMAVLLRRALTTAPAAFANTRDTLERDYLALRTRLRQAQHDATGDDDAGGTDSFSPGGFR